MTNVELAIAVVEDLHRLILTVAGRSDPTKL